MNSGIEQNGIKIEISMEKESVFVFILTMDSIEMNRFSKME